MTGFSFFSHTLIKVADKLKSELINNILFYLSITPLGSCVVSPAQL